MNSPLPSDENQRLQEVRRYAILDTPPEAAFERLTRLAARLFNVPIAIINLIDEDRQWFKSCYGLDMRETPREIALCAHAILTDEVLVVTDARQDARFADSPIVAGAEGVRFYAGAPLQSPDGLNIGTFAVMDRVPREVNDAEIATLSDLAALAVDEMELRLAATVLRDEAGRERRQAGRERRQATLDMQRSEEHFRSLIENASDSITVVDADGTIRYQSSSIERILDYKADGMIGRNAFEWIHPEDASIVQEALRLIFSNPGLAQAAEYRYRHHDGSWHILESVGKTLSDAAANGAVINSRDITERKRDDESLQAANDQLQVVLDTIPGGVSWIDSDLKYHGVNRYLVETFQQPAEAFIGQHIGFMSISPDYVAQVRDFMASPQQQTSFEFVANGNGTARPFLLMAHKYEKGHAVLISIDISKRKNAESSLQKAHDELEARVARRTGELADVIESLREEITERRRAEYSLRASEERFRAVTEAIPQQVWTAQPDGALDYVNHRVLDYFGRTFEEMIGWGWAELIHPDDMPECMARWQHSLQTGELYEIEFRLKRASDNTYRWNLGRALPLRDGEGRIVQWFGTNTDITESKQAEAALRESEGRFRQLVEQAADAFFIIDGQARFVDVNESACKSLGYSREELLTLNISDIDAASKLENFRSFWNATLEGGAVTRQGVHRRKDGTTFPVEIRASVFEFGGERLMLALARDITERKEAEEALRESEARKGAILETALDCIITMSHEGKVLEWNPAAENTFGYSRDEAVGQLIGELIVPETLRERHYQGIAHFLATGEGPLLGGRIEVPALRADGSEILVELSITAIASDGPTVFTAYLRDITARKQTEEALKAAKTEAERANRAKSEFMSRMSHELRTPLNAILGFGQLLEMDELDAEQTQGVEQILKAGRHLLELINEVLDIARIESEQQVVEIESVPVVEMLTGALDMVRPLAATRGIEVRDDCGTDAGLFVLADRRRLNQVLLNLLANAVKYNREGGVATLSYATTEVGRLRIAISDTGLGLAPDKLDRLFTPFERLGAEDSGIEGTGLGLALSKRLVEAMGGAITVESTPEIGSTFTVELPLAPEQTPLAAPSAQPPRAGSVTAARQPVKARETGAIVLYIEDNPANFVLVQNILRHRPEVKLLAAMHGLSGLELAQCHRPDLILLDFHLPDINGDEVLRRLREEPETRDIPVVVVSADATPHQIEGMRAAGAADYLTKPLDVKQFLAVVDEKLNDAKTKGNDP